MRFQLATLSKTSHGITRLHERAPYCPATSTTVHMPFGATCRSPKQSKLRLQAVERNQALTSMDEEIQDFNKASYCNDFECTSPAIESTIKTFARDLRRTTWTPIAFSRDVKYRDVLRSFQGWDGYSRNRFVADCIDDAKVEVLSLRMLGDRGDKAEVKWQATGRVSNMLCTVAFTDTLTLNLLTGLILEHQSSWQVSQGGPLAAAAFLVKRIAWSAKQVAGDASEGSNKVLQSLTSMDDDDDPRDAIMRNPNDPTKFFQQQDTFYQDSVGFLLFLAVIWVIFQGWGQVFQL